MKEYFIVIYANGYAGGIAPIEHLQHILSMHESGSLPIKAIFKTKKNK